MEMTSVSKSESRPGAWQGPGEDTENTSGRGEQAACRSHLHNTAYPLIPDKAKKGS